MIKKILTVIYLLIAFTVTAQFHSTFSLKIGAAKTFAAPFIGDSEGLFYANRSNLVPRGNYGVEFSTRITRKKVPFFAGIHIHPVILYGGVKSGVLSTGSVQPYFKIRRVLQFYTGGELRLTVRKPAYWSLTGGVGFNINKIKQRGEFYLNNSSDEGITMSGQNFKGEYITINGTGQLVRTSLLFGLRKHFINRNGNEGCVLELLTNYGISRYFNYQAWYRLNGNLTFDNMSERGANIQLNFRFPVYRIRKPLAKK